MARADGPARGDGGSRRHMRGGRDGGVLSRREKMLEERSVAGQAYEDGGGDSTTVIYFEDDVMGAGFGAISRPQRLLRSTSSASIDAGGKRWFSFVNIYRSAYFHSRHRLKALPLPLPLCVRLILSFRSMR